MPDKQSFSYHYTPRINITHTMTGYVYVANTIHAWTDEVQTLQGGRVMAEALHAWVTMGGSILRNRHRNRTGTGRNSFSSINTC